jgi:serine/threonine protein phosphatase PrpC
MSNFSKLPMFRAAYASVNERVRTGNEDACLTEEQKALFAVSQGVCESHAEALASKIVVMVLPKVIEKRQRCPLWDLDTAL